MSQHHRYGSAFKARRKIFKEECRQANTPCWLCGHADVDFDTVGEDDSFELDHFYPTSTHAQFIADPANFRCSHRLCNMRRSNKAPSAGLGSTSQEWT